MNLARQWTFEPITVEIEPERVATASVDQRVYLVSSRERFPFLVVTFSYWGIALPLGYLLAIHWGDGSSEGTVDFWITTILGIVGPVVALVSLQQALWAIKYFVDDSLPWAQLHIMDAWSGERTQLALSVRPDCPLCHSAET